MYGKRRTANIARLMAPCMRGEKQFTIASGLDIVPGDELVLMPTSYIAKHLDNVRVETYNNETGVVTIGNPLEFYHWGAPESTAADFSGVDMRGEVVVLTRNIRIVGQDIEEWGGQIVTSDTIEPDMTLRNGSIILDSVEIYNCS
jgi:hypothetical protein